MIFHFGSNSDDPFTQAAESSVNVALVGAESSRTAAGVFGNIDFAPTSELVISVASGIEPEGNLSNQEVNDTTFPAAKNRSTSLSQRKEEKVPQYWVQLAALSNIDTAERVWSDLKKRHAALLSDRQARYFGPEDIGGSLYHIRIGPMGTGRRHGVV